jgi:hypothetical protein
MDSERFAKPTYPDFRPNLNQRVVEVAVNRIEAPLKSTEQVPDNRYPEYPSVMWDARMFTDYKPHCAANVAPPEYGNSIRSWLQHHTDAIIQVSRKRQAMKSGAQYAKARTVPMAKQIQKCDEYECNFFKNSQPNTIGLERSEPVPELFGTFSPGDQMIPPSGERLTKNYEGGRNTPRGRKFAPLGTGPVF